MQSTPSTSTATTYVPQPFSDQRGTWKTAGTGPLGLVHMPNTVTQYLGLDDKKQLKGGK